MRRKLHALRGFAIGGDALRTDGVFAGLLVFRLFPLRFRQARF